MITIYPANRYPAEALAGVAHRSLQALQAAVRNLEAMGQSTAVERATLNALQSALDEHYARLGDPRPGNA